MFNKTRNTNRQKWLIGTVLIAVVIGSLFLSRFQSSAQEPELLQLNDLPEGFMTFSEVQLFAMSDEDKNEDEGHFMDTANLEMRGYSPEQRRQLSAYKNRRDFGAVGEAFGSVVIVMNFVYDYASQDEAAAAVEILQNEFGQMSAPQPEISVAATSNKTSLRGSRFEILEGPEGDSCYWFIGQRDTSLVVFYANGFNADAVSLAYQTVWEKLQ